VVSYLAVVPALPFGEQTSCGAAVAGAAVRPAVAGPVSVAFPPQAASARNMTTRDKLKLFSLSISLHVISLF
jgi:hypothetical protein